MEVYDYAKLVQDVSLCVRNYDLRLVDARGEPELSQALERIWRTSKILERTSYTGILRDVIGTYAKPRNIKKDTIASMFYSCARDIPDKDDRENLLCLGNYGKDGQVPSKGCSLWTVNEKGEFEVFIYMEKSFAYIYPGPGEYTLYSDDILILSAFGVKKAHIATFRDGITTVSGKAVSLSKLPVKGYRSELSKNDGYEVVFAIFVVLLVIIALFLARK